METRDCCDHATIYIRSTTCYPNDEQLLEIQNYLLQKILENVSLWYIYTCICNRYYYSITRATRLCRINYFNVLTHSTENDRMVEIIKRTWTIQNTFCFKRPFSFIGNLFSYFLLVVLVLNRNYKNTINIDICWSETPASVTKMYLIMTFKYRFKYD